MLIALVQLLAIGLALCILGALLWLIFSLLRIVWVSAVQWRDLFSLDRWTEVLVTIGRNKLRTALTMISVSWGIFVLVALLGLGHGLDNGMKQNFARDATNGVWMSANKTSVAFGGYDVGRRLMFENADYARAKKTPGVEYMAPQHFINGQRWGSSLVTKRGAKANSFSLDAVGPDAIRLTGQTIVGGRFLTEADILQRRKSAVIGQTVSWFLFEGANPIGQWIEIGSVPFQVVGVFSDPGGAEEERRVYLPISTAQLAFNGGEKVGMLEFTVGQASAEETQAIIDKIKGELADRYNFDPNDRQAVRVQNNIEQFQRFNQLFWMISMFIVVIGLGTLAAGVVGVSNIMMIAVKERTKEIGVRKALGATPNSIIFMIIQEAVFLTGVAGMLGLAAGVGATELIGRLELTDFIANPAINIKVGVGAAIFLVIAGALAGYFPARAAAKVNPIHALRDQ